VQWNSGGGRGSIARRSLQGDGGSSGHTWSHLARQRWWIGGDPRCLQASKPPPTKPETPEKPRAKGVGGDSTLPLYRCLQDGQPVLQCHVGGGLLCGGGRAIMWWGEGYRVVGGGLSCGGGRAIMWWGYGFLSLLVIVGGVPHVGLRGLILCRWPPG